MSSKEMKSSRRSKRRIPRKATALVVIALAVGLAVWLLSPEDGCVEVGGDPNAVLLKIDRLARGAAQKYCWRAPDGAHTVRFIVARRSDDGITVVLDACRVCYLNNLGYRRTKGGLVCRFCGNRFSIDRLSIGKMSCLPFKLPFKVDRGWLKIRTADLESGTLFFPAQPFSGHLLSSAFDWFTTCARGHEGTLTVAGRR
jgi:uncharacterized membrane protein